MAGAVVIDSTFLKNVVYLLSPKVSQLVNWNLHDANCTGSSPLEVSGAFRILEAAWSPLELAGVELDIDWICVSVCSSERAALVAASVRLTILWNIASCSIAADEAQLQIIIIEMNLFLVSLIILCLFLSILGLCSWRAICLHGFMFEVAMIPNLPLPIEKSGLQLSPKHPIYCRYRKLECGGRSHHSAIEPGM